MLEFLKNLMPVSRKRYEMEKRYSLEDIRNLEFLVEEKDKRIHQLENEVNWAKEMFEKRDNLINKLNRNNRLERMCR